MSKTALIRCYVLSSFAQQLTIYPFKIKKRFIENHIKDFDCGTILIGECDICYVFVCKKHSKEAYDAHPDTGGPCEMSFMVCHPQDAQPFNYDESYFFVDSASSEESVFKMYI